MKKTIYFILVKLLFTNICKADTIDYCHVYYNKVKLKEVNQSHFGKVIIIKMDSIKKDDSITIKYFRDTPCFDCLVSLKVEDEMHFVVVEKHSQGTFTPISFPLADILKYYKSSNEDYFRVYYIDNSNVDKKILLFGIKLG